MADDKLRQIVERMVAAGESESDIASVIQTYKTQAPQQAQEQPKAAPSHPLATLGYGILNAVKNHPVQTLGTVGAVAAVPLTGGTSLIPAMAAAGLGGAAGAGVGTIVDAAQGRAPEGGVFRTMAREGLTQGATEAAGGMAGKALKAVGAQMYRGALRPKATLRAKYPNVVEQGLEEGAVVGGRGAKPAMIDKMKESKAAADALVADVAAGGAAPISRREIAKPLIQMARESQKAARLTGKADDAGAIVARARKLQPDYLLDEAQQAGRKMNDSAEGAFKAARSGGQVPGLEANLDKALAGSFGNALKSRVPGLAEQNALTSGRMGLAKALGDAAERPSVLANIGATGAASAIYGLGGQDTSDALLAAALVRGAASPRLLSLGGIGASRAAKAPMANLFRTALLAQLAGQEPE